MDMFEGGFAATVLIAATAFSAVSSAQTRTPARRQAQRRRRTFMPGDTRGVCRGPGRLYRIIIDRVYALYRRVY